MGTILISASSREHLLPAGTTEGLPPHGIHNQYRAGPRQYISWVMSHLSFWALQREVGGSSGASQPGVNAAGVHHSSVPPRGTVPTLKCVYPAHWDEFQTCKLTICSGVRCHIADQKVFPLVTSATSGRSVMAGEVKCPSSMLHPPSSFTLLSSSTSFIFFINRCWRHKSIAPGL